MLIRRLLSRTIVVIRLFMPKIHANSRPYSLIRVLCLNDLRLQTLRMMIFNMHRIDLRLTSFCYGLLRPMDVIRPYRLEGDVRLPEPGNETMFAYWKERLTDLFIEEIKAVGGGIVLSGQR